MLWYSTNLGREDHRPYHHDYPPVNQRQRHESPFVHMPSNLHRDRSGGARPRSSPAQSLQEGVASSWNTTNVRQTTVPGVPDSTSSAYGTPTGLRHRTSNAGLGYCPNKATTAAPWHMSLFSSLSPFVQLARQPMNRQNLDDHDVHCPAIGGRSHALPCVTNERAENHQQYVPLKSRGSLAKTICIHDDVCLHYLFKDGRRTSQMIPHATNVMLFVILVWSIQNLRRLGISETIASPLVLSPTLFEITIQYRFREPS